MERVDLNALSVTGTARLRAQIPARAESIYQIASISKQFTAAAILRLVEQGKLSVDDPARTYLPELDARFDAITIRHLLTHTSGVRDFGWARRAADAASTPGGPRPSDVPWSPRTSQPGADA